MLRRARDRGLHRGRHDGGGKRSVRTRRVDDLGNAELVVIVLAFTDIGLRARCVKLRPGEAQAGKDRIGQAQESSSCSVPVHDASFWPYCSATVETMMDSRQLATA